MLRKCKICWSLEVIKAVSNRQSKRLFALMFKLDSHVRLTYQLLVVALVVVSTQLTTKSLLAVRVFANRTGWTSTNSEHLHFSKLPESEPWWTYAEIFLWTWKIWKSFTRKMVHSRVSRVFLMMIHLYFIRIDSKVQVLNILPMILSLILLDWSLNCVTIWRICLF